MILLTLLAGGAATAQTVSVPLSHPAYPVIERWEARGIIQNAYLEAQPFTRREMAEYIREAAGFYRSHPRQFTRIDRQDLLYLLREFREELPDSLLREFPDYRENRMAGLMRLPLFRRLHPLFYRNNRNLVSLQHREFYLVGDAVFNLEDQQRANQQGRRYDWSRWSNGFLFRGTLGTHLGFYFNLTDNHARDGRWPDRMVPFEVLEESGLPYLNRGLNGKYDFDENIATLTFHSKYFFLLYGREYNQWGVGHSGNLMLSTNAPVYDQLKLIVRYWRFKFTHITAALQYVSPDGRFSMKDQPYINQFWSGSRLDLSLGKGWRVGLGEAVVYGNRSLQPGYLNPLSFFKSAEHFYGDRDNGLLSLDFSWRARPGLRLYGEWLIDDISTRLLGSRFFGNKFGWQAGILWVNPLRLPDLDLLVEYTRIKPFVYSQSYRDYNKYKHYDTILGHRIGPNSDDWLVRLQKRFTRALQLSLVYEGYRHGSNTPEQNVGGDPDRPHLLTEPRDAPFLAGIRQRQQSWGADVRYEPLRGLFFTAQYRRFRFNTADWQNLFSWRLSLNFGYRPEKIPNIFPVSD